MRGRDRILVFSAHAADPFLAAGGTLAKHAQRGDEVTLVSLSYGERSHAFTLWERKIRGEEIPSMEKIKEVKKEEAEEAAKIIGANVRFLDFGECPLTIDEDKLFTLVDVIRETRPNMVLTHWIRDWSNPDHETAGKCTLQACYYSRWMGFETRKNLSGNPPYRIENVYHYTINPMTFAPEIGFTPDFYVDIESTVDLKINALKKFKTQKYDSLDIEEWVRSFAYVTGFRVNKKYAEAFKRMWSPPQPFDFLRGTKRMPMSPPTY